MAVHKITFREAKRNCQGQVSVEFIFVLITILFFVFFLLSFSMLFIFSDYVEYATFMAARTYKADAGSQTAQEGLANQVFQSYMTKVQGFVTNYSLSFLSGDGDATAGLITRYRVPLFYLPPVFIAGGSKNIPSTVDLTSETHLGRDPSQQECLNYFQRLLQAYGISVSGTNFIAGLEDDGC